MRRWGAEGLYLAAILTIIAGLMVGMAAIARADGCPTEVTYGVAGYPDAQGDSLPDTMIPVSYEGGIFGWEPFAHGKTYDAMKRDTTNKVVHLVDDYLTRCPGSHVHLFGHSLGAAVIGDAALALDHRPYAGRISATVTGDPRAPQGIEQTFKGVSLFGITMTGARPVPTHLAFFHSYCAPDDGICDMPLWTNPVGAWNGFIGYMFTGAHTSYGFPR